MIYFFLFLFISFFSLVVLMIIHELGHFLVAKYFGVKIEEFGIGYPPRIWGKKIGDTLYSINLLPLGAFVKIYGETGGLEESHSFLNLKIWKRVLIVLGGVIAFWIVAIFIFTLVSFMGVQLPIPDDQAITKGDAFVRVGMVFKDSPAEKSGIKRGDIIKSVKVEEQIIPIKTIAQFQSIVKENQDKELTINFVRKGKEISVLTFVRSSPPKGEGPIGIGLERVVQVIEKSPWYLSLWKGVSYTFYITVNMVKGLFQIISELILGKGLPAGAQIAGPLGISVFLAQAAFMGKDYFLYLIGLISVAVAIFNLLPIPALDGGKLLFLLIEKIKGKPISAMVEQGITLLFFIILIVLALFVTIGFDIPRFKEFWINYLF